MNPFASSRLSEIYDGFAPEYDRGRALFDNQSQLAMLAECIPGSADVLDVGCGSGMPVLNFSPERGDRVTGADISPAMLALAAQHVPAAQLIQADSAELNFNEKSFDLIVSFYSLFHLEVERQLQAFARFFGMLRPEGLACFTLASEKYTGALEFCGTKVFAGVELPYGHITPAAYREHLEEMGFTIESIEHRTIGGETMLWVLVKK
ncbi:MAG: class I SAM-dependent methyltransferase [Kiritimatiellales bacterium]|nr:class I SAM-dependent methyltransferase [Kiritimatiellota bacterium]MBL7012509.1 class I SAM-dependent methyltransferase [Kiritimatiellales bacterium]